MTPLVDYVLPKIENGNVPYWRLALRGCSQLCFQTNELTGLFFLAAVLVASPIAAAYMFVAAFLAPGVRMLLGHRHTIPTGAPGLNPCLIAISLPAFFATGWTSYSMWAVLLASIVIAAILVRILVVIIPLPITALPFILVFWGLYALEPHVGFLQPAIAHTGAATPLPASFHPVISVVHGLGEAVFSPTIASGILFFLGVLVSNWRHAIVALLGAFIGTYVAYFYSHADPSSVNLGLYGFNGVLGAVSTYVICGAKLRLAILGALIATIGISFFAYLGIPALSAPFVFTLWIMIWLGWVETSWHKDADPG
ncbi:urea transporter [Roseibium sp. RKSG952]|uniref:urea transporter n=1 Tax=Roseibium sp. RKSG952 TaxID=2529384 RepID=UPI001AD8B6A6|nr:urea transporter [Roseibium sp. RKSG952]